jgi:hypothetical protein
MANYSEENWQKSQEIVITTLTPGEKPCIHHRVNHFHPSQVFRGRPVFKVGELHIRNYILRLTEPLLESVH